MADPHLCSIPNCGKPVFRRNWCNAHYQRWRRHGEPLGGGRPRGDNLGSPFLYYRVVVLTYVGDECLIWPFSRSRGYGTIRHDGCDRYVHRLVCEEENGPPPSADSDAAHSCGRGKQGCVTKGHMSWKTRKGNEADKLSHGTIARGERNGHAKLTEAEVLEIRRLKGGMPQCRIAERFSVSEATISEIMNGKKWRWLREDSQDGGHRSKRDVRGGISA